MGVFDALLANEGSKAALLRLAGGGRLPQAILIEGPRGSGRFTLARGISALGVCGAEAPGCGGCPDCRMALGGRHPDVEVFAKADAPGSLTIKSLRSINGSVATPPVQARRRVVVLRDIQDAAQIRTLNTLLKVIEEPPEYLMFVITVDSRENVLPTIVSRCLLLRMELPGVRDCAGAAQRIAQVQGREEEALRMAELTGGNIGRTAALLSDTPQAKVMADALAMAERAICGDSYDLLQRLQKYERDRAGSRELTGCLREVFGRIIAAKYGADPYFAAMGQRITAARGMRVLDILDETAREGRQNVNLPLALARLGARICGDAQA